SSGDWAREIAALNAWGRLQGERAVETLLATARQNQQHGKLYRQAEGLAAADPDAAAEMLRMVYQAAPKFGDPRGLAARLGVATTERKTAPSGVFTEKKQPVSADFPPAARREPPQAAPPDMPVFQAPKASSAI